MRHKSVAAVAFILVMVIALAGCNYVSRPTGAGNNASDTSSMLATLLEQPTKTIINQTTQTIVDVPEDDNSTPPSGTDDKTPTNNGDDNNNNSPDEPKPTTPTSPFAVTTDVFEKIQAILSKVEDDKITATSATGVSDALMNGRTVYVYTPYDISGKDEEMMKSVANKLNMTVVVNNLNVNGVKYSVQMKKLVMSGAKADLMYVDQNTWGDISYYTQPISSFVNFTLGDSLNTFRSSMSRNYTISDAYFKSEQSYCDYYVASGIGAPYLLAYNKANLVSTGTLPEDTDATTGAICKEISLADPVQMYADKTWGLKAMQKMLINSTVGKCVGLASIKDDDSNVDWWFGCDNVPGFKLDKYSKAAQVSSEEDNVSIAGKSRDTLDTIQELYWTSVGSNDQNVATFIPETEKDKAVTKLFNTYTGKDSISKYAMLGINATDLKTLFAQANGADWDFVSYPYGTATENKVRATEPDENGKYLEENGEDEICFPTAGWASGFAVLERCANPGIALRFAEDYTVAWRDNYESQFKDLLSDAQYKRYQSMRDDMGVTFYRSMMSHVVEAPDAYTGASSKISNDQLSAMAEFTTTPELFTHLIYAKDTPLGAYSQKSYPKWSSFFNTARADGMAASYQLARVMFNY